MEYLRRSFAGMTSWPLVVMVETSVFMRAPGSRIGDKYSDGLNVSQCSIRLTFSVTYPVFRWRYEPMEERRRGKPRPYGAPQTRRAEANGLWAFGSFEAKLARTRGSGKQIRRSALDDNRKEIAEADEQYTSVRLHARD